MGPRLAGPGGATPFSPPWPVFPAEAGNLDTLDAAILGRLTHPQPQGMQFDVRVSHADVGRALGVDEETVRTRLKRLQEAGVVQGWRVAPNPSLLGRGVVRFDLPPVALAARDKVRAGLAALDGAMWLFEYHTGAMALVLFLPPGPAVDRTATLLGALAGPPARTPSLVLPRATVEPTALDWRIAHALRTDPRKPYAAVAAEAGASERTVRRRVEALTRGSALMLTVDLDWTRARGGLPVTALVDVPPGPERRGVEAHVRAMPTLCFLASDERGLRCSVIANSVGEVGALEAGLAALPGVRGVHAELQMHRRTVGSWLDEELARRAAAPAAPFK